MSSGFDIQLELPLADFALTVSIDSPARVLAIFGPSGAGKTSLIEAVAGWRRVRRGRIAIGEHVLLDSHRSIDLPISARGIGYVPQDLLLFLERTAQSNIRLGPRVNERAIDHVAEVLELRDLLERPCSTLSGGERQRVALARALCSSPRLLLFDEPLGSLDQGLRSRILPYLLRVRDEFRLPMIFVSHDQTEVRALCEHVVVLERGRVVSQGTPSEALSPHLTGLPTLENVLPAVVEAVNDEIAEARIAPGASVVLSANGRRVSEPILIGLAADDVLVSVREPVGLSARNCLAAVIVAHRARGGTVWLEAEVGDAPPLVRLTAEVTPATCRDLDLVAGKRVYLLFKASACRTMARS